MRRPRSHILEEESWRAFQNAMPPEWVVRKQNPDYALDVHVQLFENEVITPFNFYVQLKGTDATSGPADRFSYPFRTDHLRHYLELPFPVMLAVYSSHHGNIRFEWVHDLYRDANSDARRRWHLQQTIALTATRDLAALRPEHLTREIKRYSYAMGYAPPTARRFTIGFSSDYPDETANIQYQALRDLISRWHFLRLVRNGDADASICFLAKPSRIELMVTDPMSITLEEELSCGDVWHRLRATLLVGVALLLNAGGQTNEALVIVCYIMNSAETLPESGRLLLSSPRVAELFALWGREAQALVFAERLIDSGEWSLATMLSGVIVFSAHPEYFEQLYRRLMGRMLNAPPDERCLGALHYNIGSSLYREGNFRLAFKHYRLAARSNPSYRRRRYWLSAVAHCLAWFERYRTVETIYRQMVHEGCATPIDRLRLAAALLYQGRLAQALECMDEYVTSTDRFHDSFTLQRLVMAHISVELGDSDFVRDRKAARNIIGSLDDLPAEVRESEARRAIGLDPLCGAAWLEYAQKPGVSIEDLCVRSLTAAFLLPSCEEAWVNAATSLFHLVVSNLETEPDPVLGELSCILLATLRIGTGQFGPNFTDMAITILQDSGFGGNVAALLAELERNAEHIFADDFEYPMHVESLDGHELGPG